MADIRDKEAFLRGRWNWTSLGYEEMFPGKIQFSDIDAVVERNGHFLFVETKHSDGPPFWNPPKGQEIMLRRLAMLPGVGVLIVHGNAERNAVWRVQQYKWLDAFTFTDPTHNFTHSPYEEGPEFLKRKFGAFIQWAEGTL